MVITTVSIDPETYRRLRLLAIDENTNVRVIFRRALDEFLKRRERTSR
jgi:predicted transcriptional regulator